MQGKDEPELSVIIHKVLLLLADLNQTPEGEVLFSHTKQLLSQLEENLQQIERAYTLFISLLLDACASLIPEDSIVQTHIHLVQTRLQPPLSTAEIAVLNDRVEELADLMREVSLIDGTNLESALFPLLNKFSEPLHMQNKNTPTPTAKEVKKGRRDGRRRVVPLRAVPTVSPQQTTGDEQPESQKSVIRRILDDEKKQSGAIKYSEKAWQRWGKKNTPQRTPILEKQHPVSENVHIEISEGQVSERLLKSSEIQEPLLLPNDIMDSVYETPQPKTKQNSADSQLTDTPRSDLALAQSELRQLIRGVRVESQQFGVHLALEIDALTEAGNIDNIERRRHAILELLQQLSAGHLRLAKQFDLIENCLATIESENKKLSGELDRARLLSLTDDLTALPNRRAFLRRLDDEISRSRRYGFPLTLVLLDIDNFKAVNDEFGHNAGDVVLRAYAKQILTVFRHHDMIARYGGEEFAVLLPNTELQGVLRALSKAKDRIHEVKPKVGNQRITTLTFSAGVAQYSIGESAEQLIDRADLALYRAKRLGRNRIEVYDRREQPEKVNPSKQPESYKN